MEPEPVTINFTEYVLLKLIIEFSNDNDGEPPSQVWLLHDAKGGGLTFEGAYNEFVMSEANSWYDKTPLRSGGGFVARIDALREAGLLDSSARRYVPTEKGRRLWEEVGSRLLVRATITANDIKIEECVE